MDYIKASRLPTGGIILGRKVLRKAFMQRVKGRRIIVTRAKTHMRRD